MSKVRGPSTRRYSICSSHWRMPADANWRKATSANGAIGCIWRAHSDSLRPWNAEPGTPRIALPAAFTLFTGKDHWEVLVRARAIENQVFMIAAGQFGTHPPHHQSYGRSMVVDPWGITLAVAPDEACFVVADLDLAAQDRVREKLPSLANRKPEAYRWPEVVTAT